MSDTKRKTYNGFSKIDRILNTTAKTYNLETALYKHQTIKYWQETVGSFIEEAKELSRAIDFSKGVLTVACLSKEVASKIKLLASRIMDGLNKLIGRRVVFAIHVEL